jgi:hypothetical protein
MDDTSADLEDLRHHYSGAYRINGRLGTWTAVRLDGKGTVRAENPERLRDLIRLDYAAQPVPRD